MKKQDGTIMSPLDFIPVAEDTGLIIPIGYWIFDTVCQQLRYWLDSGINNICLGINLSARQFSDHALTHHINEAVGKYNLLGNHIDLEITESIALQDMDRTINILQGFKQRGYTISIDDFGTGYSSLSSIHLLPIDILKIDRAFIKDIGENGRNGTMAKTIINMAHNLNLKVIAEGAEDEHHIKFLRENDCDEVQGYYYSKPLPADEFLKFHQDFNRKSGENVRNAG